MPPVWVCTQETQQAPAASGRVRFSHAGLWGLARTCREEVPTLKVSCVDLDPLGRRERRALL